MKTQAVITVVLLGLLASAFLLNGDKSTKQFESFMNKFGKTYTADEAEYRRSIFKNNLEKISQHNIDETQTFELGVTQFADLTNE